MVSARARSPAIYRVQGIVIIRRNETTPRDCLLARVSATSFSLWIHGAGADGGLSPRPEVPLDAESPENGHDSRRNPPGAVWPETARRALLRAQREADPHLVEHLDIEREWTDLSEDAGEKREHLAVRIRSTSEEDDARAGGITE